MGIQLADPAEIPGVSAERRRAHHGVQRARRRRCVEEVLDHIDDTVPTAAPAQPATCSSPSSRGPGGLGDVGKPTASPSARTGRSCSRSDWRNFEAARHPVLQPGPRGHGPEPGRRRRAELRPDQSADALSTFHTPNDNLQTMNALHRAPTRPGTPCSEGWAKGMEFCAQLLAWGMLQHDQGGAQTRQRRRRRLLRGAAQRGRAQDQPVTLRRRRLATSTPTPAARTLRRPTTSSSTRGTSATATTGTGRDASSTRTTRPGATTSKLTVRNRATGADRHDGDPDHRAAQRRRRRPCSRSPRRPTRTARSTLKFDYKGDREGLQRLHHRGVAQRGGAARRARRHARPLGGVDRRARGRRAVAGVGLRDAQVPRQHGHERAAVVLDRRRRTASSATSQGPSEGDVDPHAQGARPAPARDERGADLPVDVRQRHQRQGPRRRWRSTSAGRATSSSGSPSTRSPAGPRTPTRCRSSRSARATTPARCSSSASPTCRSSPGARSACGSSTSSARRDRDDPVRARRLVRRRHQDRRRALFREIGQTTQKAFTVSGKPQGHLRLPRQGGLQRRREVLGRRTSRPWRSRAATRARGSGSLERCASLRGAQPPARAAERARPARRPRRARDGDERRAVPRPRGAGAR